MPQTISPKPIERTTPIDCAREIVAHLHYNRVDGYCSKNIANHIEWYARLVVAAPWSRVHMPPGWTEAYGYVCPPDPRDLTAHEFTAWPSEMENIPSRFVRYRDNLKNARTRKTARIRFVLACWRVHTGQALAWSPEALAALAWSR
jgi:hypothetical protein